MPILRSLGALPLLVAVASAAIGGPGSRIVDQAAAAQAVVVPGAYIVEFEDGHSRSDFARDIAGNASVRMDLDFRLFRGASIQFNELHPASGSVRGAAVTAASENLESMPAVRRIWPMRQYSVPKHTRHWAGDLDHIDDAEHARAMRRAAEDTMSTHVMTQVDKLRAKGITGSGIRVAVVDTGVDYLHPALGGCYGPGCLIGFGYDLVSDAYNGSNTAAPSNSPPMDCNGHGTHVSGILAAQGNNAFGVTGAAPGIELGMFRVFGCQGNVRDDVLIAAFNRAFEAGADIITSSVGGSSGWSEEAWSVAAARIVENGVPCTVSAGNDGSVGLFYTSTAADGKQVVAVASVDNTVAPTLFTKASFKTGAAGTNSTFGFTAGQPANFTTAVKLPLWTPPNGEGFNNSGDAAEGCTPYGNGTDLAGYVVLVRRGTCFFTAKAANAARRGAKYILVYNNVPGTLQVDVSAVPGIVGIGMVTSDQGAVWAAALARNETVTVAMTDPATAPKTLINIADEDSGGAVSSYSSWGPTFDVDVKPQFATPGGQILSTYLRSQGSYAVLSGTSMACPLLAGIYALLMEARGTRDPKLLENLLAATAKPVVFNNGETWSASGLLASVAQQGAGLVQAHDAAYATTQLSVSSLSFNDTEHHVPMRNFTITNRGHTSVVYTVTHIGAAAAYTYASETAIKPARFPAGIEILATAATLNFSSAESVSTLPNGTAELTVVVPAGQRRVISVSAAPPLAEFNPARLPVYSGFVAINGSDGTSLTLPYLGVAASMRSFTVLDSVSSFLSHGRAANVSRVPPNTLFVLPPRGQSNDSSYANRTDIIQVNLNLVMGSPIVRADLVPIRLCSAAWAEGGPAAAPPVLQDILGYHTLGSIKDFPSLWASRDTNNASWDGTMADGTFAPPGLYKLVFHALHIFGDATQPSDYDIVESVPFQLRYFKATAPATSPSKLSSSSPSGRRSLRTLVSGSMRKERRQGGGACV